jgi:hypothetical protein
VGGHGFLNRMRDGCQHEAPEDLPLANTHTFQQPGNAATALDTGIKVVVWPTRDSCAIASRVQGAQPVTSGSPRQPPVHHHPPTLIHLKMLKSATVMTNLSARRLCRNFRYHHLVGWIFPPCRPNLGRFIIGCWLPTISCRLPTVCPDLKREDLPVLPVPVSLLFVPPTKNF